jgi:mycothiol synthase
VKTHAHRPYRDASDIALMTRVAGRMFARVPSHPFPGIEWVVFGPHGYTPSDIVRLWEDPGGEVVGWAVLASADSFEYRIVPELLGTTIEEEMIRWGIRSILAWRAANALDARCVVECWDGDHSRSAILAHLGFTPTGVTGVLLTRTLASPLPRPATVEGWTVSGLDEAHIDSRARTQFEAFSPGSRTTPETWRRMMRDAPGYDADLDNIAVGPDDEVGAAALVWLDHERKVGEFEPVGTRPTFQRRGLGRLVMLRGLAKMREGGMDTAIVGTNAGNAPAIALYESVGFEIINRVTSYERTAAAD